VPAAPRPPRVCHGCGTTLRSGRTHCARCTVVASAETFAAVAEKGRAAAHTPEAEARRSTTQRRNALAWHAWTSSDQPAWLTEETYAEQIQPRLTGIAVSTLASRLGVSRAYAAHIRAGQRRPHPRHWLTLALLIGIQHGL